MGNGNAYGAQIPEEEDRTATDSGGIYDTETQTNTVGPVVSVFSLEGLSPPVFSSVVPVVSILFMVFLSPPVLPSVISMVKLEVINTP
jgi:hypothetical protein